MVLTAGIWSEDLILDRPMKDGPGGPFSTSWRKQKNLTVKSQLQKSNNSSQKIIKVNIDFQKYPNQKLYTILPKIICTQ